MANQEQLEILKQGVDVWNEWMKENDYAVKVDLSGVKLRKANLAGIELVGADLAGADLSEANLTEASLAITNLEDADLSGADLSKADLDEANLTRATLTGSNFRRAEVSLTNFGHVDLSQVIGLEDVVHKNPSTLGIDTIQMSMGKIPHIFLLGCGLSDADAEYVKLSNPNLSNEEINKILYKIYDLRASRTLQISPLFISYSHADSEFVNKIGDSLNQKGIRYWRDIHEMKSGRMEKQIDRAIRQNPTVLLVLSEHSLSSDWVEHEVLTARDLEKEMGRDVLCPVALDDSWKNSPWPKRVMEQVMEYNILDFSAWNDDGKFGNTFNKLIDGLGLFYKG